jgi:hypothetical protein
MNTEICTNSAEHNEVLGPQKEQTYYTIQNMGIVFQGMVQRHGNIRSYMILDTSGKDCVKITIDDGDPEKEYLLGGLSYKTRRHQKNRRYIPGHYAGLHGYLTNSPRDRYKSCTKRKKRCIRK